MKKYILSILSLLFLNTVYSQVLYDENFDSFTLGNLGTDPDGIIPGQGDWLTECVLYLNYGSKSNSFFTITNEPGKGKVLTLSSDIPPQKENLIAKKTGLNTLIDQRASGNNVIKFEIDYYTGPQHFYKNNPDLNRIILTYDNNNPNLYRLFHYQFLPIHGVIYVGYNDGSSYTRIDKLDNSTQDPYSLLPFNTWVKFIVYLDYTNKKIYFETPYFGTVVAGDFLNQSSSTNLMQDFKPSAISLGMETRNSTSTNQILSKYDNIKITALNAVPPEVIALSATNFLSEKFNLYPNPATNVVNITNSENMFVEQVVIYDVTGKQLSTQAFNNEAEIQLNVGNPTSGVYMLHIQTNEGTAVKKLVKK